MKLGKDGRPYILGIVKSLVSGKEIELEFLVDTGSTSGQLPSLFIKLFGKYHHTKGVIGSLGEELDRDFYSHIRISLPGTDIHHNQITLMTESFVGEAASGRGPIIGTNQLLSMQADLVIKYSAKEFFLLRNY